MTESLWLDCPACGGDGWFEFASDDDDGEIECQHCRGAGGWSCPVVVAEEKAMA